MADEPTLKQIRPSSAGISIVFVHGYGGGDGTWGSFPELLDKDRSLDGFGISQLVYSTSLAPDFGGSWRGVGDPDIATLAEYMQTQLTYGRIQEDRLAIVAHSMGGLIAQRALLDGLEHRASHLIMFGTPSAGKKTLGGRVRFWKKQVRDMDPDEGFIPELRADWDANWASDTPFNFKAVAGDQDQFIPQQSSLEPFSPDDCEVVVGDHSGIVKPEDADNLSYRVVAQTLVGDAAPGGPWSAARVAVERGDFQRAIDELSPHASELDDRHLVKLALALDGVGEREQAIDILRRPGAGTDPRGVLAGRLKRRWRAEGRATDAREALELYRDAYDEAAASGDDEQAHYLGINVAFMLRMSEDDKTGAADVASDSKERAIRAPSDKWSLATQAEALLYLDDPDAALGIYRHAVTDPRFGPRELESMHDQVAYVAEELFEDERISSRIEQLFRSDGP